MGVCQGLHNGSYGNWPVAPNSCPNNPSNAEATFVHSAMVQRFVKNI